MKPTPFLLSCGFAALFSLSVAQGQTIVADWQFNTPGDNEGWTGNSFTVNNLHVGPAVSGSEIVLTSDNLQNQADPKINFPAETLSLPGGSPGWDQLVIRIRQIGDDGETPVTFDNASTFAMLDAGNIPWPTLGFVDGTTGGGNVPVTQVTEAGEWNVFTYDLSFYTSGSVVGPVRLDPVQGTDTGTEILGNFEIDYVTLTAQVPEPGAYALMAGLGIFALAWRRRQKRAC